MTLFHMYVVCSFVSVQFVNVFFGRLFVYFVLGCEFLKMKNQRQKLFVFYIVGEFFVINYKNIQWRQSVINLGGPGLRPPLPSFNPPFFPSLSQTLPGSEQSPLTRCQTL